MRFQQIVYGIIFLLCLSSCKERQGSFLFEYRSSEQTNIEFSNNITIDSVINVIDFQYCYNGGGVGVGDFNNDGFPDLIFTGNQVSSKLYLNKGDLSFLDVTEQAQLHTDDWVTGVSIVDINADGWDDIYLNVAGANCNNDCKNLLYLNQGLNEEQLPVFEEKASEYGLDDAAYSQQTVFFDYDLDGDLDAYILRNGNVSFDKNSPMPKRYFPDHLGDLLLRNDVSENYDHPVFSNVSDQLKGAQQGFGLGVGINDLNNDGNIDIYVANDFITNDLLYINTHTSDSSTVGFKETSVDVLGHQTYNAMGVDIADLNNDLHPDIMVLDMLPNSYQRLKTMIGAMNYDKYELSLKNGYSPQYMRNTLQIHNGATENEKLRFAEVSFLAKLSQTDWSWTPLMIDLDADGDKDIFVTNGYGTDITDLDFINYTQQNNAFGTEESRDRKIKELVSNQKPVKLQNFFFENKGNLNFEDVSLSWSKKATSLSNGAAYADLDLDGDLDLIVNNINEKAFVLENKASDKEGFRYLKVKLQGSKQNKHAIGAKITLWINGIAQTHFQSVVRGYLSSMDPIVLFGLNENEIDSLEVQWPSGKRSFKTNIAANQTISFSFKEALAKNLEKHGTNTLFVENDTIVQFKHQENVYNDFLEQQLLLTKHSMTGPCLAVANVDILQGDELFIGGSKGKPGTIWTKNGIDPYYQIQKLDSLYEDTEAVFFDFDGDNDLDLYVGSGSNEFLNGNELYEDRLYENNGNGHFTITKGKLPMLKSSTSVVKPFDYDKDGDIDLFVGSGIVPGKYPATPKSYLLSNEDGVFSHVDMHGLLDVGMIKDASWSDIDGDGWFDLVLVGDWMPITVFKNHLGSLKPMSIKVKNENEKNIHTNGWWRTLENGDFDNDGDIDFMIGNQGLNNFINPEEEYPYHIIKTDYDGNGSIDPLIAAYYGTEKNKKLMPLHSRDDIMKQLVQLKNRYQSYDDFSKADFKTLLDIDDLDKVTLKAYVSQSAMLENLGNGNFKMRDLPFETQIAPINSILVRDFNGDGNLDALVAGNDFHGETHFGRYDALTGVFLKGNGKGGFEAVPSKASGFYLPHQTNEIIEFKDSKNHVMILAGQNNEKAKVFEWKQTIVK